MNKVDETAPAVGNAPEFTVSELSGAVKRSIEGEFSHVRVRGEISRVSRPSSGHLYFDLKDDRAVLASVSWKGQAGRMSIRPEEGMEVIAIGRLTTFPGQSKYQLIVEDLVPAGAGALMAMLDKLKERLTAEGLFDPGRKKPLPYLPEVVGIITSPSGAVIRDILHRFRDRFPRHVLLWPVAVQGDKCPVEVAAAIRGFNALAPGGRVPRPDLLIVARGGGSIEDLWGFNDEMVVRAAAHSVIPLISAVGHETDTTLIDYAADRRAPTPTAAAEMAVPVRDDLLLWVDEQTVRLRRAVRLALDHRNQRLGDLARSLGRPESLTAGDRQRLDLWSDRLPGALRAAATRKRVAFLGTAGQIRPALLRKVLSDERGKLGRAIERLGPAFDRLLRDTKTLNERRRHEVQALVDRLSRSLEAQLARLSERLAAVDRTRQTLGYRETLKRGYAVVRAASHVVTTRAEAAAVNSLEIEFVDGKLLVAGRTRKTKEDGQSPPSGQDSLF